MASTYLTRTMSGGSATTTKFTFSAWVKRTGLSSNDGMQILSVSNEYIYLGFFADTLRMEMHDSDNVRLRSNAVFRDTNAWYHVVFTFDSTQSTASDRMKMWVNNEQITDFSHSTYPSLNYGSYIGGNTQHTLGRRENDDSDYFDGIISHAHLTVGYTYTPSAFGSTDSTTGEWKINTSPSVSYGNNGFFILKDGNSVTDQSGNSNNFTVGGGTLTNTEDCPSNVFCTINPLFRNRFANTETLTNGNLTMTTGPTDGDKAMLLGTIGVTSGKWYWECKAGADRAQIGFAYNSINRFTDFFGSNNPSDGFSVYALNGNVYYDGTNTAYGSSWTTNDIIMVALDMDNKLAWLGKNGTWFNSATQTEIENGTATNDLTTKMGTKQNLNSGEFVFPMFGDSTGTGDIALNVNFGNGYFGTTAVSSAGTNASNIGIFEYDVPTGYTALSTKGLNL